MDNFNEFQKEIAYTTIRNFCKTHGKIVKYRKGELFAEQGQVSRHWGIVTKGNFAYTIFDSTGNERIIGFALTEDIIGNYASIVKRTIAPADIIALSNSEVAVCDLSDFTTLITGEHKVDLFSLADSLFNDIYTRYIDIYRKTAKERYQDLLNKCPEILHHITLGQLASYLMITQTHLSRIRKEISIKK